MALLFMDGFDHLGSTYKWDTVAATTVGGRFGTGRYVTNADTNGGLQKSLGNTYVTLCMGVAVKINAFPASQGTTFQFRGSTTPHVTLAITNTGQIAIYRGASTSSLSTLIATVSGVTLTTGIWYYIEMKATIDATAGAVTVNVNGVQVYNGTALNTKNTSDATTGVTAVKIAEANTNYFNVDDVYVCDTTGTVNNGLLGDVRVATAVPSGAGSSAQWTPTGSATNFGAVSEVPQDDDTSYVASSTVGQIDSYAMGDVSLTGAVKAVAVNIRVRKDDAGTRTVHTYMKSGATTAESADISVNATYSMAQKIHETDPNTTAAWTVTGVNAMEAGVKEIA